MLECIEIETGAAPTATVIWLHGLGADGRDFEPIVPELAGGGGRRWRFVFPHAPVRAVTVNGGARMRAWYDIKSFDRKTSEDEAGFLATNAQVRELIDREGQRGIAASRIVLAGFSQGGAVSLYVMPRLPEALAGVVALSCYLPLSPQLDAEQVAANVGTPIFMAHGREDSVITLPHGVESRDFLQARGYKVDWRDYPMTHTVCPQEIADIREFLFKVLPG